MTHQKCTVFGPTGLFHSFAKADCCDAAVLVVFTPAVVVLEALRRKKDCLKEEWKLGCCAARWSSRNPARCDILAYERREEEESKRNKEKEI